MWKIIETEKITGYSHRAPQKRNVNTMAQEFIVTKIN
jgi:hypothetical protein